MKAILSFIRNTITGGVLFLLPVVLIIMLLIKAHELLSKLVAPVADLMPEIFFGFDGSRTITLLLMIALCFFSGLMFRSKMVRRQVDRVEDNFLSMVPGYALIKSVTADALGHEIKDGLIPVLVTDGTSKKIGFMSDEKGDLCVVFFPEPLKSDSGEVVIMPKSEVERIHIPTNKITLSLKRFGKGLMQYVE